MFDDMIADTEPSKKLGPRVIELFFKKTQKCNCFYITILFQSA